MKEESDKTTLTKYSIVPKFWGEPNEIAVTDMVSCQNKYTKELLLKFFDSEGRLWENVKENDVIVIKNFPDKEDVEDFMRLKHETEKLNKQTMIEKPQYEDVSIR